MYFLVSLGISRAMKFLNKRLLCSLGWDGKQLGYGNKLILEPNMYDLKLRLFKISACSTKWLARGLACISYPQEFFLMIS